MGKPGRDDKPRHIFRGQRPARYPANAGMPFIGPGIGKGLPSVQMSAGDAMVSLSRLYREGMAHFNNDATKFVIVTVCDSFLPGRVSSVWHAIYDLQMYGELLGNLRGVGLAMRTRLDDAQFAGQSLQPGYVRHITIDTSAKHKPFTIWLNPMMPGKQRLIPIPGSVYGERW